LGCKNKILFIRVTAVTVSNTLYDVIPIAQRPNLILYFDS